jgi:hypothetical protein
MKVETPWAFLANVRYEEEKFRKPRREQRSLLCLQINQVFFAQFPQRTVFLFIKMKNQRQQIKI